MGRASACKRQNYSAVLIIDFALRMRLNLDYNVRATFLYTRCAFPYSDSETDISVPRFADVVSAVPRSHALLSFGERKSAFYWSRGCGSSMAK